MLRIKEWTIYWIPLIQCAMMTIAWYFDKDIYKMKSEIDILRNYKYEFKKV